MKQENLTCLILVSALCALAASPDETLLMARIEIQ